MLQSRWRTTSLDTTSGTPNRFHNFDIVIRPFCNLRLVFKFRVKQLSAYVIEIRLLLPQALIFFF